MRCTSSFVSGGKSECGTAVLCVHDLCDGSLLGQIETHHYVDCCAVTPDDTRVLTGSYDDNELRVWSLSEYF